MIAEIIQSSQSIPIEVVAGLIVAVLGAGGGFAIGRKTKAEITNDPLSVKRADEFVSKEDFEKFEKDIKEDIRVFKKASWEDTNKIYERINEISTSLSELIGEFRAFNRHHQQYENQSKNNSVKSAR